jgi:hypothetical protein
MLRTVITPVFSPGVLVYHEIWSKSVQRTAEARRALAWELTKDEDRLPPCIEVTCCDIGFVVVASNSKLYHRLIEFSDVIFIQEGCYVLSQRGPIPYDTEQTHCAL